MHDLGTATLKITPEFCLMQICQVHQSLLLTFGVIRYKKLVYLMHTPDGLQYIQKQSDNEGSLPWAGALV